jgi:hypothetical protein
MLTSRIKHATEIDQLLPVQLQRVDRGTADRCETDDEFEGFVPREMVTPHISTGMEENTERVRHAQAPQRTCALHYTNQPFSEKPTSHVECEPRGFPGQTRSLSIAAQGITVLIQGGGRRRLVARTWFGADKSRRHARPPHQTPDCGCAASVAGTENVSRFPCEWQKNGWQKMEDDVHFPKPSSCPPFFCQRTL